MRETTSPGIATRGFPKQFTDHLKTSLGVVSAGVTKAATVHAKQAIAPSSTEDAVNASTEALQKQTETLQTHYDDAKKGVVKDIKSLAPRDSPIWRQRRGSGGRRAEAGSGWGNPRTPKSRIPGIRDFGAPESLKPFHFSKSEKNPRKIREPGGGEKGGEGGHKGWAAAGWAQGRDRSGSILDRAPTPRPVEGL